MTARSFNARNGLSVGTTPTEVVDSSGNVTTDTLTATTGNITTLNVSGDLTVSGTTTYINTTTLNVGDNIVTLNADFTTGSPTENAGIEIRRGSSANTALRWNESSDVWEITQDGTNYGRIHSKLTDIVLGTDTSGNYVSAVTSGTTALTVSGTAGEGWSPNLTIRAATTAVDGIVQLTDSVASTSTTTAATPNSVKTAYDVAFGRISSVDLATTANTVANKGILSITPTTGGGAGTRDDVFFVGSGTTTVSSNASQITISSADQYTGTVTSIATANGIGGGTITGTGTLYAVTGATLVSNATGIHMPNVATAGSSTGGISAITIDAQGRVTSVTGSAGYVTSSGVTSVGSGNGLTGGPITSTGTLSVSAGTGVVSNASGVHIGQDVATTAGVTFANVTIQNNATYGILSQVASGNASVSTANITFTSNTGGMTFNITSKATNSGDSSPNVVITTGDVTGTGSPGNITIEPGSKQYQTGSLLTVRGSEQTNTTSGSGGRVNIYGGAHTGGGGGGTDVYGGSVYINGGAVSNSSATTTNKRPGSVYIDGGTSANATGLIAPSIFIGTTAALSNVVIGSATSGNTIIYANGSVGTAGQVLHSNGTSTYWASDDNSGGTVTSVATGNGLTGGAITTTGTISVVANNGIVANSTGVFVNAQSGLTANSSGLYAVAGSTLVSNATGIHMPNVVTAGSSTGGISAITLDAQGRVTSVTGSAGYLTSAVTSVTGGNGLTGSITTTGSLAVGAGSGITVNADDVAVNAQSGLVANATGLYVRAGTGIVANATGVHVSLTDSVSSTSTTTAATPNSVKTAYDLAASKGTGTVTSVGGTGTVNGITLTGTVTGSGNLTLGGSITAGSTTTAGIVQLTDSVSSTSTTTAATPNSVKTAYDLANGKAATNQTMYIGTTAVAINRASAAISLTGTSIDGSAGSVAWTNVSGRPTAVSSFTNDSGYITSSGQSVNKYAALRYSYSYDYGTQYVPGVGFTYTASGTKNVSSVTYNSAGDLTINFTNAFADANYKAFLQGPGDGTHVMTGIKSQTTTSCRATTKYTANSTGGQFFVNPGYTHNFVALEFA